MPPNYHVIKDPVHGTMQFTQAEHAWVKPFIDSPHVQRLRHVKQLGLGDLIFPGAVHTRFNHSLGCCYVGNQIAQKIGLADHERQTIMIACLLHDVGHGPFSHAFEDLFHERIIRHEDWTPYFLADYVNQDLFASYNQKNPQHPLDEEKFAEIAQLIMHKNPQKNLLSDIVSSQLDADRLDYLLRDNHFCGVRYGTFDFRWMIHCLAIIDTPQGQRLGITHKGIGVVEHYLMARRLMIQNIYQGQKKLAIEWLLKEMLLRLTSVPHDHSVHAPHSRLMQFLNAVRDFNEHLPKQNKAQAKRHFIETNFTHYQSLTDYDVFILIDNLVAENRNDVATAIATRIKKRALPHIERINHLQAARVRNILADFFSEYPQYQAWQLAYIQTPHRSYSAEADPIYVINERGQIKPLGEFSLMINAISDKLEHIAFLAVDQAIRDEKAVMNLVKYLQTLDVA